MHRRARPRGPRYSPRVIQDPLALLAVLATVAAAVFQAERAAALQPLFRRLPALVWIYFLPMAATTAGLLPSRSPLYEVLGRTLLPASLVLLLLSTRLRTLAHLGRTALLSMTAGMAGIALGALLGYGLLRPWLAPDAWKAAAALVGTWTGGSANLVAVATALALPPEQQGVVIVVDTVVGYSWMAFLIALAGRQETLDRWLQADDTAVHEPLADAVTPRVPAVGDLALMVALALAVTAGGLHLGARLPPVGDVLNASSWGVVLVTTTALLLSLTPLARLEEAGASTLGYCGFYVLLASVGAQADLRAVAPHRGLVLLGLVVIAVHAIVLFGALRLLRAPSFWFGAASQACLGGCSSAPVVAALYRPGLAPVGLLLAVLGNVVGTYLGLAVGQVLARW